MEILHEKKLKLLEETAILLRQDAIEMIIEAGSGHPAGALGMADIFSAFYFHILNHNPKNPLKSYPQVKFCGGGCYGKIIL